MAFGQQNKDQLSSAMGLSTSAPPQAPRSLRDKLSSFGGGNQPGSDPNTSDPASASANSPASPNSPPTTDPNAQGGKASRDDAGFIPAGQICGGCQMYTKETGDCSAVEGQMQPHDSCKTYYQAANAAQGQPSEEGLESKTGSADPTGGVGGLLS